ncbi:MAG: DNA/RNA non-specific endonuclease [Bacteroidota bacterium]|nr:DNA/RNA non-specific endonuclease [Bacteroidota bacterium]
MKKLSFFFLLFVCFFGQSQTVEIFDRGIYKSYFSILLKEPLYVVYELYEGGGDCDRSAFHFKPSNVSAKDADYEGSGYDKGHLANAEDFAFDCKKDEETFEYINCLPQTPKLNRGKWKIWERIIRDESWLYHLLIVCGGIFEGRTIGDGVAVPSYCWKIVYNEDDDYAILHCFICPNDNSNTCEEITLYQLERKLGYELKLPK